MAGIVAVILVAMVIAIIGMIRRVLLSSFNLQKHAENSAQSVYNLMNSLPDSVLLCSDKSAQSTDEII
jgi:hypothetical protein